MLTTALAVLTLSANAPAQIDALIDAETRAALADAFAIVEDHGDAVWPGLSEAPRQAVIVTSDLDVLFCPEAGVADFELVGVDAVTGCMIAVRARTFPPTMAASFPAVGARPTLVLGTPEAKGMDRLDWTLVAVHERFHQFQASRPDYYAQVNALNLSGGDETGTWMLNYPFPYGSPDVEAAFESLARRLLDALDANEATFLAALDDYWRAREQARTTVPEADWRYYEFQLWHEGVSRWTERAIASAAGDTRPELAAHADERAARMRSELEAIIADGLGAHGRLAVYALGAGEAELLERVGADWRAAYLEAPMQLRSSVAAAVGATP